MSRKQQRIADKLTAQQHAKARRSLALKVFNEIDVVIDAELAKFATSGRQPTCSKGCSHCCRQEIYVPRAEVEAIVEWLQNSAPHLIDGLQIRLKAWLDWYRSQYPKLAASGIARQDAFCSHGPYCPALVDDACSIYPVRPVVCRTHYVRSPVDACRPDGDPQYLDVKVETWPVSIKTAPIAAKLRALIESQGGGFQRNRTSLGRVVGASARRRAAAMANGGTPCVILKIRILGILARESARHPPPRCGLRPVTDVHS